MHDFDPCGNKFFNVNTMSIKEIQKRSVGLTFESTCSNKAGHTHAFRPQAHSDYSRAHPEKSFKNACRML